MNRKFYVKKISGDSQSTVNSGAANANGGSILKTGAKVGIFRTAGSNYYNGSDFNNPGSNGIVLGSTGSPMPSYSNMNNALTNSKVKSVFNKFFSGSNKGTTTPTTSNFGTATSGLNAFAYMNSNLWNGVDPNRPTAS